MAGASIALSFAAAAAYYRRISAPVRQLMRGVEAPLEQGNLDWRIGDLGADELGALARRFDVMAEELRLEQAELMILMLTARDSRDDKIIGRRSGAADYLTTPFDFDELLARVAALLRRGGRAEAKPELRRLGDLVIDGRRKTVSCGDRDRDLGLIATEFALFGHLADNQDKVLSRDSIMRDVWRRSGRFETNLVDVHIRYLRRKLDAAGRAATIATVRGFSYVLEVDRPDERKAPRPTRIQAR